MPLSKLMLGAAKITLDAVFKASAVDIRVHDVERVPAASVIYVVNHFTRMETAFLPYIIFKHTGKHALSLAHHSFFKGKLQKFLQKMGAVSTKDPDRDLVLTNAMLTGNMSLIIFPEGTRVQPGKTVRYKQGGASLAVRCQAPVIPIAHNAGECWPRVWP